MKAFRKFRAYFARMAQTGKIYNRTQFKKLQGDLWEFKVNQHRIGCYQDGKVWVLTHGLTKKRDSWPQRELDRGLRIIEEDKARAETSGPQ
jgi:hypothetical protein